MARYAITGATGFVGSGLLRRLAGGGHDLKALARPRPGRSLPAARRVEWIRGDLTSPEAIAALVTGVDTVFHLAGRTAARGRDAFHAANTEATAMLGAAARRAGVRRFVFVSSLAASRPDVSPYALSKALAERALQELHGDMQVVILRPPAVLGPGDRATRDVMALLRRGWLPVPGGKPHPTFSWIDVDDFARFASELPTPATGALPLLLSPCSGQDIGWTDVARAAETATGRRVRCIPISPRLVRTLGASADGLAALVRRPVFLSSGKAAELLQPDWHAADVIPAPTPLSETLSRCLQAPAGRSPASLGGRLAKSQDRRL